MFKTYLQQWMKLCNGCKSMRKTFVAHVQKCLNKHINLEKTTIFSKIVLTPKNLKFLAYFQSISLISVIIWDLIQNCHDLFRSTLLFDGSYDFSGNHTCHIVFRFRIGLKFKMSFWFVGRKGVERFGNAVGNSLQVR